jgi:hypothetical protein
MTTFKTIHFAYFHSIMTYSIVFWGNSVESKRVFHLPKKIRIMTGSESKTSWKPLFVTENNDITFTINTILNEIFVT